MKSKLTLKQPSDELKQLIDQAVRHFHASAGMVEQAFIKGRSEGFSDQQIGRMIKSHMLSLGYDPSTIRRALPSSAKDTTKTRKDYLSRQQYNNNELYERKNPSYENRNGFDGNRTSEEIIREQKNKIGELESQLDQERDKNEDLTIQRTNATIINSELRGQLEAVRNATSILVITRDNFPPDYGRVFSSQDYVFAVEFRDSKVLDVSVMTLKQVRESNMKLESSSGGSL
jgi:hypothetical protein